MHDLAGNAAFQAISNLLAGSEEAEWSAKSEPSIERLRVALSEPAFKVSMLDLAVLLRQALRREYARREYAASPQVHVQHPRLRKFADWSDVGLHASKEGQGWRVVSEAWQPNWLENMEELGVDDYASGEEVQRKFGADDCEGDPFLGTIGRKLYRSKGQRAAVRAALSTPPGGTLVVALPTGEGKSMIFQLVHAVGFANDGGVGGKGVTLVIVPTVALGLNHEQEAVDICGLTRPLVYQGGESEANDIIAKRMADGTQGLCFASPEAVCGPLRKAVRDAAEAGFLKALVVDEAHLVDQWGIGFRTEFQELSGLRRELQSLAPNGKEPRTILLSATLTDSSLETLQLLFGTEEAFENIAIVKLRPEPEYWISGACEEERTERVLEALHHVPRPGVLYVTKVQDACDWANRLRDAGFCRFRVLHGKSTRSEREEVVDAWRAGSLDVVVGTSAFGLGIDYPHARSVVHACVPETLDRFYQEVGRGGRDGRASLSLIIPSTSDFATADSLNRRKVISIERGLKRWTSMFEEKRKIEKKRIAVKLDQPPGVSEEDIDMTGEQSADWSLRTLALMARSGLIRLCGLPSVSIDAPGDWLEVEVRDDQHLQLSRWKERVQPLRDSGREAGGRNLDLMKRFLADNSCPADIFSELYGRDHVIRSCSRCSLCRSDPCVRKKASSSGEPRSPWKLAITPLISRLVDADGRLLVTYDPSSLKRRDSRQLGQSLQRLQQGGLAKLIFLGRSPFDIQRVLKSVEDKPFFVSHLLTLAHSRLPEGPELVLVGPDGHLRASSWGAANGKTRMLLVPRDQVAESGHLIRDIFGGRRLTLDEFHAKVAL